MTLLTRLLCLTTALALGAAPLALRAESDADAAAGRALVKRYADAVIGVEMVVVLKINAGDRAQPPQERKIEVNGTVIAPNGLTVLSLGLIDPRAALPPQARASVEEPEFKEVKLRLADNTEIPAKVVLKDEDLDLAFIAPEPAPATVPASAPRTFACVDLASGAKPKVLGTYFDVSRAGKILQRVPMVRPITVVGVVEKPRQLVLLSAYAAGCPVFDPVGKFLGISVMLIVEKHAAGMVLLPAASIAEIAPKGT